MPDKELAISMSLSGDYTLEEIATICGYKNNLCVTQVLRNAGITKFPRTNNRKAKDERNNRILSLRESGESYKDIAHELEINEGVVSAVVRGAGLGGEKHPSKCSSDNVIKTCKECGASFSCPEYSNKIFCSNDCQRRNSHRKNDPIRRARKKKAVVDSDISLEKLCEKDDCKCYLCGMTVDWNDWTLINGKRQAGKRYPTIDHIVPLSRGGKHSWGNVKLACFSCNSAKGARDVG
jgi:5-methylcytosine-specific restriction endonuclease McrA